MFSDYNNVLCADKFGLQHGFAIFKQQSSYYPKILV